MMTSIEAGSPRANGPSLHQLLRTLGRLKFTSIEGAMSEGNGVSSGGWGSALRPGLLYICSQ